VEARFPSEPNGWALLRVSNDADVELIERLETYAAARWTLVDHRTIAKREDGVHLIVTVDREAVGFVLLTGKSEPNGDIELRRLLVAGNAPSLQDMALRAVMDLSFLRLVLEPALGRLGQLRPTSRHGASRPRFCA
jgi:hypothetical protein